MSIIEILQQIFGATEEQSTAFSAAMKDNGIFTTSHENMDVRYPKLKGEYDTLNSQYGEAQKLIGDMKKATKGQEDLQGKITTYEGTIQKLQAELAQAKIDAAIKVGLLSEKAVDVDYLTFKLNEKLKEAGEALTLDDNGNIKGWKDKVDGLKTQFPNQFETGDDGSGFEVYDVNKLRRGDSGKQTPTSLKDMSYEDRVKLYAENPTLYNKLKNNGN